MLLRLIYIKHKYDFGGPALKLALAFDRKVFFSTAY